LGGASTTTPTLPAGLCSSPPGSTFAVFTTTWVPGEIWKSAWSFWRECSGSGIVSGCSQRDSRKAAEVQSTGWEAFGGELDESGPALAAPIPTCGRLMNVTVLGNPRNSPAVATGGYSR